MRAATKSLVAASDKKGADQRKKEIQRAAVLLKHLSDATRLQIVRTLSEGEVHVGALCEALGLGQAAVSHHLSLLRHGSIAAARREGKRVFYALTATGEELAVVLKAVMP